MKTKKQIVRVGGFLKEVVTVRDEKGNVLHRVVNPLMLEFRPRDMLQVVVGSTILAVPVGFTEEVWVLAETLPFLNILILGGVSLIFISAFVYYNFYRNNFKGHKIEFLKRALGIYVFSFAVVSLFLFFIGKAPWGVDSILALKRVILVSFPASMSAAVADMIK